MKPNILFVDPTCPKPYDTNTLLSEGMGGSEATMVRIVDRLLANNTRVACEQHNRAQDQLPYVTPQYVAPQPYTHVVTYRSVEACKRSKAIHPQAKHYLWLQDLVHPSWGREVQWLLDNNITILCVSKSHREQAIQALRLLDYKQALQIRVMYNPIEDTLAKPEGIKVDPYKLVWLSAPVKGWDGAKEIFSKLHSTHPEFKLHVYNPGYAENNNTKGDGIVYHGPLANGKLADQIADSLCLFYPNTVFPETFGIVMAECDALGVPVLAHSMGAAPEVTDHPSETMDCRNHENVIKRVLAWSSGERPVVQARKEYRLKEVAKLWERLFQM